MPVARIVRSAPARKDLSDLYQHLASEAGLEIADTVLARITEAIIALLIGRFSIAAAPS